MKKAITLTLTGLFLFSMVFADAGIISNKDLNKDNYTTIFESIRTDAGIGFTYSIKRFGPLENIKPLTVRFDIPLFLNKGPETANTKMKWLIGINRAF